MTDSDRIREIREEAEDTRAHLRPGTWLGDYPLEDIEVLLARIDELEAELERLRKP